MTNIINTCMAIIYQNLTSIPESAMQQPQGMCEMFL